VLERSREEEDRVGTGPSLVLHLGIRDLQLQCLLSAAEEELRSGCPYRAWISSATWRGTDQLSHTALLDGGGGAFTRERWAPLPIDSGLSSIISTPI